MATSTTSEGGPRNITARVLAPLALAAVLLAVVLVIAGTESDSDGRGGERERRQTTERTDSKPFDEAVYVVEPGDTLTSISEKTGVSITAIEQLNPNLDTQTITSGQEIKLR